MEQAENSERSHTDRISSLPDHLLHLVLSLLTTRQAVRTCTLSKRWKNVWITLPNLYFNQLEFRGRVGFLDFVNMTLRRREVHLHKFRLSCYDTRKDMYGTLTGHWIPYALKCNPRELHVEFYTMNKSLPPEILTCPSLEDVSINCQIYPEIVNLPCLRRLCLLQISVDQDLMERLLCGCPLLEYLHLRGNVSGVSCISSQSLKYLEVSNNHHRDLEQSSTTIESINAPNLVSFNYYGFESYFGRSNILVGLSNVQKLELGGKSMKDLLERELPKCPKLWNLVELSLNFFCFSCHFLLIASFLDRLPNLRKLSLDGTLIICEMEEHGNYKPMKITPLPRKQLETVQVNCTYDVSHQILQYLQNCLRESGNVQIMNKEESE